MRISNRTLLGRKGSEMQFAHSIKKIASLSISHVAFSFLAMGGWAFFANRNHPMPAPIFAGLLQGALSGSITYLMKKALDSLSHYFGVQKKRILRLIAPPIIVCSISSSSLAISHALAGTPELVSTIIVPSSIALLYASIYSYSLWRGSV